MAKNYTKKSDEEKKKEIEQLLDSLHKGVKAHFNSDSYKSMLRFMGKQYRYSNRNKLLIYLQKPDSVLLSSYNGMKEKYGFQVKKGEKGIKILAPNSVEITVDKLLQKFSPVINGGVTDCMEYLNLTLLSELDGTFSLAKKNMGNTNVVIASHLTKEGLANFLQKNIAGNYIFGYHIEHIYDITQCEPIKDKNGGTIALALETINAMNDDLTISPAKDSTELLAALESSIEVPITYVSEVELGGAYGIYSSKTNSIKMLNSLDDTNRFVSLVHEYAHCLLHDKNATGNKVNGLNIKETAAHLKRQKEIEAESIAFIVCDYYGVYNDKSFEYIAFYSKDTEAAELMKSLDLIHKTSRHIIDNMDIELEKAIELKEAI